MLEQKVNGLEQQTRKNNVIITGVPLYKNEQVERIVEDCGRVIGVDLGQTEVDACHRLPARNPHQPPSIVVRLVRRTTKFALLKK